MKRISGIMLLVVALVFTSFSISANTAQYVSLQERLGNAEVSIIDKESIIYYGESDEELPTSDEAVKALITYEWSLSQEEAQLIESTDYFDFVLDTTHHVNTIQALDNGLFGVLAKNDTNTVRLSFNELVGTIEDKHSGSFTVLVDIVKPEVKAIDEDGPQSLEERLGVEGLNIMESGSIIFIDDEGNEFPGNSAPIDTKVRITFNWNIPNSDIAIQDGDYFEFQIPDDIKIPQKFEGELRGANGVYGNYVINTDGSVKLTFFGSAPIENNVTGTVQMEGQLNENIITSPGIYPIDFPIKNQEGMEVDVSSNLTESAISKKVSKQYNNNNDTQGKANTTHVEWDVVVNNAYKELNNVTVIDTLSENLDLTDIKIYTVKTDHDGKVIEGSMEEVTDPSLYTIDVATGKVVFNGTINSPYIIRYTSEVDETKLPKPNDTERSITLSNNVSLTSDEIEDPITAGASTTASYDKLLMKDRTAYNASTQTFSWLVKYNYLEKTLNNASITDTLDPNLEFVQDTVKVYKKGTNELIDASLYDVVFDSVLNTMKVKFKNTVTEAFDIKYDTRVKEGVIISENTEFTNKVSTYDGETIDAGGSGTAIQQSIIKTTPGVDHNAKTITWKIDVNVNKYPMTNVTITDTYQYKGLVLKEGTLRLVKVVNGAEVAIPAGPDTYTLTDKGTEGFSLSVDDSLGSEHLRVHFITDYDSNDLIPEARGNEFRNKATLDWTDQYGVDRTISDEAKRFMGDIVAHNGSKSGYYNAIDRNITWTVNTNFNGEELKNAYVKDVVQEGQKYIDGSLEVYKYRVNTNGTIDVKESDKIDLSTLTIVYPSAANGETLTVNLPDGSDKYQVVFKTSLDDTIIKPEYKNQALFNGGVKDRILDAKVSVNNGGTFTGKTGKQDGDFFHWEVAINKSQSTIKDAKITDTPSTNLILVEDSFKVFGTKQVESGGKWNYVIDETNELVRDVHYKVDVTTDYETSQQSFELVFLGDLAKEINETYILKYTSILNVSKNDNKIKNNIVFSGNGTEWVEKEGSFETVIQVYDSSGTGNGNHTAFSIKKVDAETSLPLAGVVFELYNANGVKVATRETNSEGTITFNKLYEEAVYTLKEVKTIDGYVISDELYKGITIKLDQATLAKPIEAFTYTNSKNKLHIVKVDEAQKPVLLNGFEYKLEVLGANDEWTVVEENIVLVDGKYEIVSPVAGSYRLTETKSHSDYLLNQTPLLFDIVVNANDQLVTKTVNFVNYKGSFTLVKQGFDGTALAGVEFSYTDAAGNTKTQKTNAQGTLEVKDLAPGTYKVQEVATVGGHIVDTKGHTVVIASSAQGKPAAVEIGTVQNKKANVQFRKTNVSGQSLAGSVFELTHAITGVVGTYTSNAQGIVSATDLAPGTYTFKEIKATEGYIINTAPIEFTIAESMDYDDLTIELTNYMNYKGSVELFKTGYDHKPLPGVTYSLYTADGALYDEKMKTDANGLIRVTDLLVGSYYFLETESAEGNILNRNKIHFAIAEEALNVPETVELVAHNTKAAIEFKKLGSNGEALAGVEFALYADADLNTVIATATSTADGTVRFEDVSVGDFTILETKSADGHIINTTPIKFTVDSGTDFELVEAILEDFNNYKGSVKLAKTGHTDEALAGVIYNLYLADGTLVEENLTTDVDGFINVEDLNVGSYYFEETASAEGHILNTNTVPFEITAEALGTPETVEVSAKNIKAAVEFKKLGFDGKALEGVEFALYANTDLDNAIATTTSLVDGTVRFEAIAVGEYTIVETKTVDGHVLNTAVITFTVDPSSKLDTVEYILDDYNNYKGSVKLTKTGHAGDVLPGVVYNLYSSDDVLIHEDLITSKDGTITVEDLNVGSYYFVETASADGHIINANRINFEINAEALNTPETIELEANNTKAGVEFTKLGSNGEGLEGAEFALYLSSDLDTVIDTATSSDNGLVRFENVSVGEYTVIETKASHGHILNTTPVTFTIDDSTELETVEISLEDFNNYKGSVELHKTGHTGESLTGVVYNLYLADGTLVYENLTTDDLGLIVVEDLAVGSYYFEETASAEGHIINTNVVPFEIVDSAEGVPATVQVTAKNIKASVSFVKTDSNGEGLGGAIFELLDVNGTLVTTVTSDENGYVYVEDLAPGKYSFKEVKAPVGYILNTEAISFEIEDRSDQLSVDLVLGEFINYQGSALIKKVNESNNLLKEATFELRTLDDKVLGTYQTVNGVLRLDNLAPGEYKLVEVVAPKGYILDATPHFFTVLAKNEGEPALIELKVVNKAIPVLPSTGVNNSRMIEMGLILNALGLVVVALRTKRREESI